MGTVRAAHAAQMTEERIVDYQMELYRWKSLHVTANGPKDVLRMMSTQSATELGSICASNLSDRKERCDEEWKVAVGLYLGREQGRAIVYLTMFGQPVLPNGPYGPSQVKVLWSPKMGAPHTARYTTTFGEDGRLLISEADQFISELANSKQMTINVYTDDGVATYDFNTANFPGI